MNTPQTVLLEDLGRMDYATAWTYQEELLAGTLRCKKEGQPTQHHFLLVEHPPVYTLGKSGKEAHVLLDAAALEARGIQFFRTNRGGDITYHGPGQIVGYPVLDLERLFTDIGRYLRLLEEVIIEVMADYGLKGERSPGETGVWLEAEVPGRARKICAMGVRCSRWVTMHGFAFNVNTDLNYFEGIVPCGIRGKGVTSLQSELGRPVDMEEVKGRVAAAFSRLFGLEPRPQNSLAR